LELVLKHLTVPPVNKERAARELLEAYQYLGLKYRFNKTYKYLKEDI
jgi:hypothetical protein